MRRRRQHVICKANSTAAKDSYWAAPGLYVDSAPNADEKAVKVLQRVEPECDDWWYIKTLHIWWFLWVFIAKY